MAPGDAESAISVMQSTSRFRARHTRQHRALLPGSHHDRRRAVARRAGRLPHRPGMPVTADIMTGKRTVLTYLLWRSSEAQLSSHSYESISNTRNDVRG